MFTARRTTTLLNVAKRTYIAATTPRTPIIPAKITTSSDGHIQLEAYAAHHLIRQVIDGQNGRRGKPITDKTSLYGGSLEALISHDPKQASEFGLISSDSLFHQAPTISDKSNKKEYDWQCLLTITPDGYVIRDKYGLLTETDLTLLTLRNPAFGRDAGENKCNPFNWGVQDLLYKIPTNIWEKFVAMLAEPELVNALGLLTHRHLLPGYNFAISAPTYRSKLDRAKIIGLYHFLIYPSFHLNEKSLRAIFDNLENGNNIREILTNHFHMLPSVITENILKKIAYSSSSVEVAQILKNSPYVADFSFCNSLNII